MSPSALSRFFLRFEVTAKTLPQLTHVHKPPRGQSYGRAGSTSALLARLRDDPSLVLGQAVSSAPPQLYFVVSAVFHYLGPAFAVPPLRPCRRSRRGLAADPLGRAHLRRLAPTVACRPGPGCQRASAAAGVGRRVGDHELDLLPGHRPPAAGHRCSHRIRAGHRPCRARRAHGAQWRCAAPGGGGRVSVGRRPCAG